MCMSKTASITLLFKSKPARTWFDYSTITGLILGLRSANERRRYKVTPSLIGWAQT